MQTEQLFAGSLFVGALAAMWSRFKLLLSRAISLFIVTARVEAEVADALSVYCWHHFKSSPFGGKVFSGDFIYVKPLKRATLVLFEVIASDPVVFWAGHRPIVLSSPRQRSIRLTYIRGLFQLDALLQEAVHYHRQLTVQGESQSTMRRFYVHRVSGKLPDRLFGMRQARDDYAKAEGPPPVTGSGAAKDESQTILSRLYANGVNACRILEFNSSDLGYGAAETGKQLDYLYYPPDIEEIVENVKRWLSSRDWYATKGLNWRYGLLLYGLPGSGKTAMVRALGCDLDMPIHVFDLSTMNNEDMVRQWTDACNSAPCIILFEDFDLVFHGRKNIVHPDMGVTFDCLLNLLGGVEPYVGVLVIVTTNDVDKLDAALGKPINGTDDATFMSTRPSRLDRAVYFGTMSEDCRRRLANKILSDCPERIEQLVADGDGDTAAQFSERCSQVALRDYWNKQHTVTSLPV